MELEVSVLKYTQCGRRRSRLLYTLSPPVIYPQDFTLITTEKTSRTCLTATLTPAGLVASWATSCLAGTALDR